MARKGRATLKNLVAAEVANQLDGGDPGGSSDFQEVIIDPQLTPTLNTEGQTYYPEEVVDNLGLNRPDVEAIREGVEHLDNVRSTMPKKGAVYAKIHRFAPNNPGRKIFLADIPDAAVINDVEVDVKNLAVEKGWPSGEYEVSYFCQDPKTGKQIPDFERSSDRVTIEVDRPIISSGGGMDARAIIDLAKDIAKGSGGGNGADSKSLTDILKAGIEITKGANTNPKPDAIGEIERLQKIMDILGVSKSKDVNIPEMIKAVKDLMPQSAPQPSVFEMLKLFKELFPTPPPATKEDPIKEITRLGELMGAMKPFMGGEKSSVVSEIATALGPYIPQIATSIADIFKNAKESLQELKALKTGTAIPPIAHRPIAPIPVESLPEAPAIEPQPSPGMTTGPVHAIDPTWQAIYAAIESRDVAFYPAITNLISMYAPEGTIEGLIEGNINIDEFLRLVATRGGPFILSQKSKEYFSAYVEDIKKNLPSPSPDIVYAKCQQCGSAYEFADEAAWNSDNKICEDCKGEIIKEEEPNIQLPAEIKGGENVNVHANP